MSAPASTWITLTLQVLREGLHHLLRLVQAQQAVVDENAGELPADRLVDQRRGDRGIDAAGKAEDDFVAADLFLDFRESLRKHNRACSSRRLQPLISRTKRCRSLVPCVRVRHFRVELHAVEAARLVGHAGDRAGLGGGHQLEPRRHLDHLVAVAHPDLEQAVAIRRARVLDAVEQLGMAARAHFGVAELAQLAGLDLAAELLRHRLHAVADAEHRARRLRTPPGRLQGGVLVGRGVAARENDAPLAARSRARNRRSTSQGWISQ